jgi:hypothetical protein
MFIDYLNAENGLSKDEKNGLFPWHCFAYEKSAISVANRPKTRVS